MQRLQTLLVVLVVWLSSEAFCQFPSGRALSVDGNGDYVLVQDHPSLDWTGSFTVELWFKTSSLNTNPRLIGKGTTSTTLIANWSVALTAGNVAGVFWESADDANHEIFTINTVSDTQFHYFAAVIDIQASEHRVYLDGIIENTGSTGGDLPAPNNNPLFIAARPTATNLERFFNGLIDEVRLWNVARTTQQIQNTWNTTLGPEYYNSADSGLVAYWRCDTLENLGIGGDGPDDIRDFSINGNHGDLAGDARLDSSGAPLVAIGNIDISIPNRVSLDQNYPNPFNPATTIRYDLRQASSVVLKIYNTLGQEVLTLVDKSQNFGEYTVTWDGRDSDGIIVSSGVYIYQIQANDYRVSRKMLLIR